MIASAHAGAFLPTRARLAMAAGSWQMETMSILRGLSLLFVLGAFSLGLAACAHFAGEKRHWSQARWDSAGVAPAPERHPEAIVQVYGARAWGWRGIFGVHTWIAFKRENARAWDRFEVVGWGVQRGVRAIRHNRHAPDGFWAGSPPELLGELRGEAAARAIPAIEAAIESYPHDRLYRLWPGPNSNSFTAHVLRAVPGLDIELPPNAIGKDFLGPWRFLAPAPSRTGFQLSLFGLAGLTLAMNEGVEINLLGFTFGLDITRPAIKLPGLGRLGMKAV